MGASMKRRERRRQCRRLQRLLQLAACDCPAAQLVGAASLAPAPPSIIFGVARQFTYTVSCRERWICSWQTLQRDNTRRGIVDETALNVVSRNNLRTFVIWRYHMIGQADRTCQCGVLRFMSFYFTFMSPIYTHFIFSFSLPRPNLYCCSCLSLRDNQLYCKWRHNAIGSVNVNESQRILAGQF